MEVCSRQMIMTLWGQPTARGENEMISSSSIDIKQRGPASLSSSPAGHFSTCKHKNTDPEYAECNNIVNMTDGTDDCEGEDDVGDDTRLDQQQQELNNMQVMECSMCGHMGLSQYLFKCLSCSYRYQHIYCSNMYPYRVETAICNWCLPMETEMAVEEVDILYNCGSVNSDIATKSDHSKPRQLKQIKKHSKAFEYLLQIIADLVDAKCRESTNAINDRANPSRSDDDGALPKMCASTEEEDYEFISRKPKNLDLHHGNSSLQQSTIIQEEHGKSDIVAGTDQEALGFKGALSHARTLSKRPRCLADGSGRPMKVTDWCAYDQVIRKSPDHNENKMGKDQDLWIQNNALIDDYEIKEDGITTNGQSKRRPRSILKKQSMETASGVDCISKLKAVNQQKSLPLLHATDAKMGSSDDDGGHGSSALLCNKLIDGPAATAVSSTSTWVAASNQSKPVTAGKRDFTNSPSRAFSRRYKLLADVLC